MLSQDEHAALLHATEQRAIAIARVESLMVRINDTIPAYISYVDRDLRYVYINQTYLNAFGRTAEMIEGHLVADVLGPSFPNVRDHLLAALAGHEEHFETRMGTVHSERILSVAHIPDRDATGDVIGVIIHGADITDRRRAEAALMQSEKLAAVGRLASTIAHEINNPLEAVTNLIYLARAYSTDPLAIEYLETADRELRRVSTIANKTLRFNKQSSNPMPTHAEDLLSSVLTIYEGRLRNSGIEVVSDLRAKVPVVCFEGDVRQILNNLVSNAIDAMPHGGKLLLRSHEAPHPPTGRRGVVITVADTGSGISASHLPTIFDPFFTTKDINGTGLGLWVSKEIVDRHKGTLRVRSRVREDASGTVFRLFLPHS
ncbi:nitrogen regulation protein NR(II) [Granulicella cerasi]|uniref:histidine kinase n=1 Tax=Granulicella cerasi TaxID=741063 RepID=A0ABW1Z501_9BACT|nr:ATP-binding protein [Granulicella cerasi]